MSHRKIPATRGLYWCLEAWRLFKASPQPIFTMSMWLSLGIFLPVLNFFVVILLTIFYGGMILSLHKKALGEKVRLGDFFSGFKSLPQFLGLFLTGLPSVLLAFFSSSVLVNALGPDMIKTLTQPGPPPSKEMLEALLPIMLSTIMKLLPIAIVAGWIVFLAVPRVALDNRQGLPALWDALRAVFSNLGSLLLFSLGMMTAAVISSFVLAFILKLVGAAGAMAGVLQTFVLIFIITIGFALYLNAMYIAWRDIFMAAPSTPMPQEKNTPAIQIEV